MSPTAAEIETIAIALYESSRAAAPHGFASWLRLMPVTRDDYRQHAVDMLTECRRWDAQKKYA